MWSFYRECPRWPQHVGPAIDFHPAIAGQTNRVFAGQVHIRQLHCPETGHYRSRPDRARLQMFRRISLLNSDTRGVEHGAHRRIDIDVRSVTSYPNSRARSATPPMKVPQIPSMCTRLDIKRSKMQRQAYHVLCDLKSAAQGDIDVCRSSPKRLLCTIGWRHSCHQCQCTGGHPSSSGLSRQDWKIYAGQNGILGALREELIDVSQESPEAIQGLMTTPSGALVPAATSSKASMRIEPNTSV